MTRALCVFTMRDTPRDLRIRFRGRHHARYIDPDVPLHIISRVVGGMHLLRPCEELNRMVVGVVGRARQRFRAVKLYGMAFMSNHAHFIVQGPPDELPAFMGYIKREIARRWNRNPSIDWSGPMWLEYSAVALPTDQSQRKCLRYVLSQGVKEGLVDSPKDWPGVHCATSLSTGEPMRGSWLNCTALSRSLRSQSQTPHTRSQGDEEFRTDYELAFDPLPAWRDLDAEGRLLEARRLIREIEVAGRIARNGRPPLGARKVMQVPTRHCTQLPRQPWQEGRRRMICWASPTDEEAQAYVARYWAFQIAFRIAAHRHKQSEDADFPLGSFAPGKLVWPTTEVAAAA